MPTMIAVAVASFVAMEGVSYASHRWLMHGPGMRWHSSHHAPPRGGFEANDLFPAMFSLVGFGLFLLSAVGPRLDVLFWAGVGVTAYGAAYLFVHDVYIHERVPIRVPKNRVMERLRGAHGIHHQLGGEPYGMLFPIVSRALRERANARETRKRL